MPALAGWSSTATAYSDRPDPGDLARANDQALLAAIRQILGACRALLWPGDAVVLIARPPRPVSTGLVKADASPRGRDRLVSAVKPPPIRRETRPRGRRRYSSAHCGSHRALTHSLCELRDQREDRDR